MIYSVEFIRISRYSPHSLIEPPPSDVTVGGSRLCTRGHCVWTRKTQLHKVIVCVNTKRTTPRGHFVCKHETYNTLCVNTTRTTPSGHFVYEHETYNSTRPLCVWTRTVQLHEATYRWRYPVLIGRHHNWQEPTFHVSQHKSVTTYIYCTYTYTGLLQSTPRRTQERCRYSA